MTTLITTTAITQPMTTTTTVMLEMLEFVAEDVGVAQMAVYLLLEEVDAQENVPRLTRAVSQAVKETFLQGLSKPQGRREDRREGEGVS